MPIVDSGLTFLKSNLSHLTVEVLPPLGSCFQVFHSEARNVNCPNSLLCIPFSFEFSGSSLVAHQDISSTLVGDPLCRSCVEKCTRNVDPSCEFYTTNNNTNNGC